VSRIYNRHGPVLLIDTDVLRYQLAYANTTSVDWDGDGNTSEATQAERAKAGLEDYLNGLVEQFDAHSYVLALSCPHGNFRKTLYPAYKENRKDKPKPALWYVLDAFIYSEFADRIIEITHLEGDDVLGLLATHPRPKWIPDNRIVVSIDKDMQTLPGIRLYMPHRSDEGVREISAHDADLYWMKQVLTGDVVDNYPGFPGIGPVKADELLLPIHEQHRTSSVRQHLDALWKCVVDTYTTRMPRGGMESLTVDDAVLQARLARILRHGDYSLKDQRVRLWTPLAIEEKNMSRPVKNIKAETVATAFEEGLSKRPSTEGSARFPLKDA